MKNNNNNNNNNNNDNNNKLHETSKIPWDFNIYTDQNIHHCRPDIAVVDKMDNRIKIKHVAVPWDANIDSKYREKVDHYKDLAIELPRLYQKRVTIIIPSLSDHWDG